MHNTNSKILKTLFAAIVLVFVLSIVFLILGEVLAATFDVIGIRIATLFVAFASFCSTSLFSYLIYNHNKEVRISNEDANKRAEMFRDLQFSSNNYSVIDFVRHITIYGESSRYVDRYIGNKTSKFHMAESGIDIQDVYSHPNDYNYISLRIPYRVVEGKLVAAISFLRLRFERDGKEYRFFSPENDGTEAFLLYNESEQSNDAIVNLIAKKDSPFFSLNTVNGFSKIKITLKITSLLGVEVKGVTELFFTNPEARELDGANLYKINTSYFILTELPKIIGLNRN